MRLALPDRRQTTGWGCGPAATRVALEYLGVRRPARRVREGLPHSPQDGTDPRTIEAFLRGLGLDVQAGEMALCDLAHHAAHGRPVLCLIQAGGVGHYVVSAGLFRGRVYYQCPADGPADLPPTGWLSVWHDTDRYGTVYRRFGIAVGRPGEE